MRLFVAITVSENVMACLRRAGLPAPANAHLTLSFIGEREGAAPYLAALSGVKANAMTLRLCEVSMFGRNILAARLSPCPELEILKAEIDAALASAGHEPEKRKYTPHITLSRRKKLPAKHIFNEPPEWVATHFALYQSFLLPSGARHEELGRFELES